MELPSVYIISDQKVSFMCKPLSFYFSLNKHIDWVANLSLSGNNDDVLLGTSVFWVVKFLAGISKVKSESKKGPRSKIRH